MITCECRCDQRITPVAPVPYPSKHAQPSSMSVPARLHSVANAAATSHLSPISSPRRSARDGCRGPMPLARTWSAWSASPASSVPRLTIVTPVPFPRLLFCRISSLSGVLTVQSLLARPMLPLWELVLSEGVWGTVPRVRSRPTMVSALGQWKTCFLRPTPRQRFSLVCIITSTRSPSVRLW